MIKIKGKFTEATIMIDEVEPQCVTQIHQMTNNVAFDKPIVIMPDTHSGKGSVIGFTMGLTDKIIPNVVGVDIGCGMLSINMGNFTQNKDKLLEIDEKIRGVVPMGTDIQNDDFYVKYFKNDFPWNLANEQLKRFISSYNDKFNTSYVPITYDYDWFLKKCKQIKINQRAEMAIGTLGGGNHFIEIGIDDTTQDAWLTIHSGSRNLGKMICEHHQNIAKNHLENKRKNVLRYEIEEIRRKYDSKEIENRISEAKRKLGLDSEINTRGMEYLEGADAINYFTDMIFTQQYASFNRWTMVQNIIELFKGNIDDFVESVHNFINFDDMIIRKGAISSYKEKRMIIPFNMAEGLLICEGKSNEDWNFSAPHGAGRVMSRGEATRKIDMKDFKFKMKDVVSTSVCKSTLDEAPQAYKKSKIIESAIEPTADIILRIRPILNLKDRGQSETWKDKKERIKKEKERRNLKLKKYDM